MSYTHDQLTHCFVDESIHESVGHVVTAFVFAPKTFEDSVAATLRKAGLNPFYDEFKSSARMDTNPKMRAARDGLLSLAGTSAKVAVFFDHSIEHISVDKPFKLCNLFWFAMLSHHRSLLSILTRTFSLLTEKHRGFTTYFSF
ncbi:MAG: hypothetical protein FP821_11040 [Sideroxydans sp.]|nr:hypothetical protein [Sideroxydans sp.]